MTLGHCFEGKGGNLILTKLSVSFVTFGPGFLAAMLHDRRHNKNISLMHYFVTLGHALVMQKRSFHS